MNKFLAIIIALILSLMGCSEPPATVIPVDNTPSISDPVLNDNKNDIKSYIKQPEETGQSVPNSDFEENHENQENNEPPPEEIVQNVPNIVFDENQDNIEQPEETTRIVPDLTSVSTQINTELFSILGMSKADAIQRFGEINEFDWWSGPVFKHNDSDYWLGYSDVTDASYSTGIFEPADDAVITHIFCTVRSIFPDQDITEKDFDEALKVFDDHDNEWYQNFEYGDIGISIYYKNDNTIDTKSSAKVVAKKNSN